MCYPPLPYWLIDMDHDHAENKIIIKMKSMLLAFKSDVEHGKKDMIAIKYIIVIILGGEKWDIIMIIWGEGIKSVI